jgi:2-methylcitrate dehydratase PrpD
VPVLFALGEHLGKSGRDLLDAYIVGYEAEARVGSAVHPHHYDRGWHPTSTMGVFGAAAAAARLLGLDVDRTATCLALGASMASGVKANFGTMTKPFHAGRAAESGVAAAQFAGYGWTAAGRILEAPRGFFRAAGGGYNKNAIYNKLGAPWTFADPGISIKPHPSGSLTHPGMTAMIEAIRTHGIRGADVKRVRVGTNSNMPNALIHHRPKDELQAKFSMEFCIAILLVDGKAGLSEFTDATTQRADVKDMIERIDFVIDEEAERAGYHKMTTIIDIELNDGRHIKTAADFGKGSPANPMSYEEVADKFRDCAAHARVSRGVADEIVAMVRDLEELPGIDRLMSKLLRAA